MRAPDFILVDAKPGCCPFCDDPLPATKRKRRVICGKRECARDYNTAYRAAERAEGGRRKKRALTALRSLRAATKAIDQAISCLRENRL